MRISCRPRVPVAGLMTIALLSGTPLFAALPTDAAPVKSAKAEVQPDALALLKIVEAATQAATSISAEYSASHGRFGWVNSVKLMRPNLLRMECRMASARPGPATEPSWATWNVSPSALLVSDGKRFTQYGYKSKEYRQNAPLPDGKSFGLVDVSPLVDFFDVAKSWYNRERELAQSGELRSLKRVGKEKWDGIDCTIVEMTYSPDRTFPDAVLDRLAGAEPRESCRFYIGPDNLIHRLVEGGNCRAVSDRKFHNLTLNPPLQQAEFAYTLPTDARPRAEPPPPLADGKIAPDFTAIGETGQIKLSDFKGKIVVLDFWATWCQPCQKAMPHLRAVYDKVQGKNVVFLSVCVWDERKPYDTWVTRRKTQYPFVFGFDPAGRDAATSIAASLYSVSGIPTTFVIDEKGVVAASFVDYRENDTRLETALAKLGVSLAATPTATATATATPTKTVTLTPKGKQ